MWLRRIFHLVLFFLLGVSSFAAQGETHAEAISWYSSARFGMFYHWGMFTDGGSSSTGEANQPFTHPSVEAFEAAVPPPLVFAKNLVGLTKKAGAKYLIITLLHSCDRHMVIYPTQVPTFLCKTKKDFLGPLLKEAHREGLRVVLYFPAGPHHFNTLGGPFLAGIPEDWNSAEANAQWEKAIYALMKELKARYGKEGIDGFWMDGWMSWQPVIDFFPNAVRIGNNQLDFSLNPPADYSTTEFLTGPTDPPYNRPSGLIKPNLEWGDSQLTPKTDCNEDIPTCNGWWYQGHPVKNRYTQDPTFWVKEMICDLGQRRSWNYVMGLGPRIDGTAPEEFRPMIEKMAAFLEWAHPAIYNTTGGVCAPIQQGWLNSGAFASITQSKTDKNTYYLLVTQPPEKFTKTHLRLQQYNIKVKSITDLRTGKPVSFQVGGTLDIENEDWSDIQNYGAKVFKIILSD